MVITQVAVVLIGMGREEVPGWTWVGFCTLYAQWLALFCVSGLSVFRPWTQRMPPASAWIASWVLVILLALVFSLAAWSVEQQTRLDLLGDSAAGFVLKSVIAVALSAAVFFRYLLIRAHWRAELLAQADARVQALQARIRPHFLFNSLNTIVSLIHDDPKSAETATLDLADIFRGSMRRADQQILLSEELDLALAYLSMEKRRLGDRLNVDWRVDELPSTARVLPLILQPLLENAVGHGIRLRPEGGTITVYGRVEGNRIVITIGNEVSSEEESAHLTTEGHGMALQNIRERLHLAFGSSATLVTNRDKDGFYAVLSLPYVEDSDR
jgi:two-component system sensor histidine kinase AlgZ